MTDDNIKVTLPLTVEDLTATTDESFNEKIIPYVGEWVGEELWRMRRKMKEVIRDYYTEMPEGIDDDESFRWKHRD